VVQQEFPEKGDLPIDITPTNDNRSYHINSDKIARKIGFKPKRGIEDAVLDMCRAFRVGKLPNSMIDERYHNVKVLKRIRVS
jgi:hypothetical protein